MVRYVVGVVRDTCCYRPMYTLVWSGDLVYATPTLLAEIGLVGRCKRKMVGPWSGEEIMYVRCVCRCDLGLCDVGVWV